MHNLTPTGESWRLQQFLDHCSQYMGELFPWDLQEWLDDSTQDAPLLLDVRELDEFHLFHIPNSINVPRGILETACDFGFEDTVPTLVAARKQPVVVICRSGKRSLLAGLTLKMMGFELVQSLQTGVKGWNDADGLLINNNQLPVDADFVDTFLSIPPSPAQLGQED